jgi:hypothetical protein
MAEIKSTLEIIMEKTKDLTFTDEEKKALRKKEVQGKVRGFITKFMDGVMNLESLVQGMASFEGDDQAPAHEMIVDECISRIDPEVDNTGIFDILAHVTTIDISLLQTSLTDFLKELDHERDVREQALNKRLREKGFSGSAVLPNLKADPEWSYFVKEAKTRFQNELKGMVKRDIQ